MENYISGDQIKIYFADGSQVTAQVISEDDKGNLECSALSKNEVYKEGDTVFVDKSNSKIEKLNIRKKSDRNYFEDETNLEDDNGVMWEVGDYLSNEYKHSGEVVGINKDRRTLIVMFDYSMSLDPEHRRTEEVKPEDYHRIEDDPDDYIYEDETDFELYSIKKKANSVNEIKSLIEGKRYKDVLYKYFNYDDPDATIMSKLNDDEFCMTSSTMGDKGVHLWTSDNHYEFPDVSEQEYDSIIEPYLNDSYAIKKKSLESKIGEVTIIPFNYSGYNYSKQKVWVDTKYKHPDPSKKMIWGTGEIDYIVSDFKGFFEKAGSGVTLKYKIPPLTTHNSEMNIRMEAINNYINKNKLSKKSRTFNWEFDKHKPQWKLNKESMEIERDEDAVKKIAKLKRKLSHKLSDDDFMSYRYTIQTMEELLNQYETSDNIQTLEDCVTHAEWLVGRLKQEINGHDIVQLERGRSNDDIVQLERGSKKIKINNLLYDTDEFFEYVKEFYGKGGIYELGVSDKEIKNACNIVKYLNDYQGDSVDREKVRDILTKSTATYFDDVKKYLKSNG